MSKPENIKPVEIDNEEELQAARQEIFSYYRHLRSDLFSDTIIEYETKLTKEFFDLKLLQLSQDKKQSEFENFILVVTSRLITPNIKPQTGPDGGGDGKVDGETYPVDKAISDKWWVSDGCTGDQRWAIAISVQKTWQSKVESDVKKVVETGRGYTKLLFFTNQKIKSSTRLSKEDELTRKYGITVGIFDGSWCSFAVFEQGCMDVAVEKLNFSDEYRKKTVIVGSNDKRRMEELQTLENGFLTREVAQFDTDYVDDLIDACLLSRGLERPRQETEGRFNRALREAKVHGSSIQTFNIIYCHAWTSFFWFYDIESTYADYLKLKEYTDKHPSVHTIENLTNILTNLQNAVGIGLFAPECFLSEVEYIKSFRQRKDLSPTSQLFLDIYFSEHRIIQFIRQEDDPSEEIIKLTDLIIESVHHPEIAFNAQSHIVDILGRMITNNTAFENLVDKVADITATRESEVQGAMIHYRRAQSLMEKKSYLSAIKHLGHCVRSFVKDGYESEYVKSCGFMGLALYNQELPYSAEAYYIKAASVLVREFYTKGTINHLLITVLSELCEIELMLGRLVMYLNWRELLYVIAHNGEEYMTKWFVERDVLEDGGWACHLAAADISNPQITTLPPILARCDMPLSANYLKFALGYPEEVDDQFKKTFGDNWHDNLLKQPIHEQFICNLNIADEGSVNLSTIVHNCKFIVRYENSVQNQLVAETFLASVETLLATFADVELIILTPEIRVIVEETTETSSMRQGLSNAEYIFHVNHALLSDKEYWECFSYFMAYFFVQNTVSQEDVQEFIRDRHEKEKIMDRVSSLMLLYQSVYFVLGDKFKYSIRQWQKADDNIYPCLTACKEKDKIDIKKHISSQQNMSVYTISSNMQLWDGAKWSGVGFVFDKWLREPPVLALLFRNVQDGKNIVKEWKELQAEGKLGIEIQIIKGINKNHPTWYRVCLAPKIPYADIEEGRYMAVMCRKHTMTPNNTYNIDNFEQVLPRFGRCRLMALAIDDNNQIIGPYNFEEAIELRTITIIDAWRVSIHDNTRNALEWDDEPIIPDSELETAPVFELLNNLREVHNKKL